MVAPSDVTPTAPPGMPRLPARRRRVFRQSWEAPALLGLLSGLACLELKDRQNCDQTCARLRCVRLLNGQNPHVVRPMRTPNGGITTSVPYKVSGSSQVEVARVDSHFEKSTKRTQYNSLKLNGVATHDVFVGIDHDSSASSLRDVVAHGTACLHAMCRLKKVVKNVMRTSRHTRACTHRGKNAGALRDPPFLATRAYAVPPTVNAATLHARRTRCMSRTRPDSRSSCVRTGVGATSLPLRGCWAHRTSSPFGLQRPICGPPEPTRRQNDARNG